MVGTELLTPRLRLRLPTPGDAERLAALSTDPEVARMTTRIPYPNSAEAVREALVAMALAGEVVRVIDDGEARGLCSIAPDGALGWWLGREARGRGYATEAARALLAHAFGVMRKERVTARVFADNAPSIRVLAKLGFRVTGAERSFSLGRGAAADGHVMELARDRWALSQLFSLVTPRLVLAPMTAADAAELAALTDLETARNTLTVHHPMTPAEAEARIAARRFRNRPGFAVGVRLDGRLVGELGLSAPGADGLCDVMMWFGAQWRRRGLCSEALAAFLPHVMDRFGLQTLRAEAFEDNIGSLAVLSRFGFAADGVELGTAPARDEIAMVRRMTLAREALSAALAACPERNAA
ncbi:GNAT family N-acetyltransferase [Albimonas pacifica]|uniref:Protein N-acetyltransferase, RimJ/RimL family n=1 Tax=Albimonas pacifica TaxID=1114924 RepID=A0A1I3PB37_9RHOB|nr:GNAT family N-acetyltransferase [Albimonas pacifica]SFJ18639.1 Protein N-acetyltransferase, RimJ/RimL family [Albimonas pacifica]